MFTGIVEEVGAVVAVEPRGNLVRLRLRAERVLADARVGDSLAHNGVCLTITELDGRVYATDVMAETLARTNLGGLRPGSRVNLERALAVGGRFDGHLVQGHVDGTGTVRALRRDDQWVTYTVAAPEAVLRYVVPRGSVALDGISLTVVERLDDAFSVSLIPHTLAVTTLGERKVGDTVNLEADILAKYVAATLERMAAGTTGGGAQRGGAQRGGAQRGGAQRDGMTWAWLAEQGFGEGRAGRGAAHGG